MKRILLAMLIVGLAPWSNVVFGAADFVAVRIEAENYTSKSDGWTLTSDSNIPDIQPDPDPPHNSTASGLANMELLPDTRVTDHDTVTNGVNFWGNPGPGPFLEYKVDVPEPGRYLVYVKSYSTGTEDNGIHVGINNTTPASGARIQLCSKHGWFWTAGQRTAEQHCGVAKSIFVDIAVAGVNQIKFFAREDGFELDQFMLLKETHDGSLDCFPMWNDKIRCKNISTGAVDGDYEVPISTVSDGNIVGPAPTVDLDVDLTVNSVNAVVGENLIYTIKVSNKDNTDSATNAKVILNLPAAVQFIASADCTANGSTVQCDFAEIDHNNSATAQFDAQVTTAGNHRTDATVTADQNDTASSNNMESVTIIALPQMAAVDGALSLSTSTNAIAVGDRIEITAQIDNRGTQAIDNAALELAAVAGVDYIDLPASCTDTSPLSCVFANVAPGQNSTITYAATVSTAAALSLPASLVLAEDEDSSNNNATAAVSVISGPVYASSNGQLVIEAERFSSSTPSETSDAPNWYVVDNQWNEYPNDPDNASPAQASAQGYTELLPDTRIDNSQAVIAGVSNFESGGSGATLSYSVAFFEAGDYFVFARIRANNDQDALLHVGLDNDWQSTAQNLKVCSPDGNWQWTNAQMISGGCAADNRATITVPAAGVYQLMVSQGTDGLELDKIILTMDPGVAPADTGPAINTLDNPSADIKVSTQLSSSRINTDQTAELDVVLKNQSPTQDAIGVSVIFEGINLQNATPKSGFDNCRVETGGLICSAGSIAAQQEVTGTLEVKSANAQALSIIATVTSDFADDNQANNSDRAELNIVQSGGGSFGLATLLMLLLLLPALNLSAGRVSPQVSNNNA